MLFCEDVQHVGVNIGYLPDDDIIRICLPFMNVGMYIGNETPDVHPPDFLRHSLTGDILRNEDGTPLLVS